MELVSNDMDSIFSSVKDISVVLIFVGLFVLALTFIIMGLFRVKDSVSGFEIIENAKPNGPYREIGRLTVEDMGSDQDMIKVLVKRAKRIGADGVIIIPAYGETYEIKLEGMAFKYI